LRSVRLALTTLVTAALLATAAPAAADAAKLQRLGRVSSLVTVDRERYVAWVLPKQNRRWVRVTDTFTGRSHRLRRPKDCTFLQGFARGRLHFDCDGGDGSVPRLFSARTGRPIRSKGIDAVTARMAACDEDPLDCSHIISAVGGHWIHSRWLYRGEDRQEVYDFTNIRTGEVRRSSNRPDETEDRNSARLYRRMCAPLEREPRPEPNDSTELFQPFDYVAGFGVQIRFEGFTLRRCGRSKPLLKDVGAYEKLTSHHVAWLTRRRADEHRILHVMNLRSRRRTTWDVERLMGILTSPAFSMTRHSLYLTDFGDRGNRKGLRFYRAALP
jgi:hypothetical protein